MCYSAAVWADYRLYVKNYGAELDIHQFYNIFWRRAGKNGKISKPKTPKGMETPFLLPASAEEQSIKELIEEANSAEALALQEEIFKQRRRFVDAERKLEVKVTKTATESKRIAQDKVEWAMGKLADLQRAEAKARDSRIFPGMYAPVMVVENGKRVVKPMRYQCRPAGKPAFFDGKFPGTYNARRDSLKGFWKDIFGFSHGVMLVEAFYENVKLHHKEHRALREGEEEQNVVLEFKLQSGHPMLIACLWSHWQVPGEDDLLSFAAITDGPPAEVAAAGHDRCIISLKQENLDAWLNPQGRTFEELDACLKTRPWRTTSTGWRRDPRLKVQGSFHSRPNLVNLAKPAEFSGVLTNFEN